jgi:hypothetical protein
MPKNINITVNNSNFACMQYGGNQQIQVNLAPALSEFKQLSKIPREDNVEARPTLIQKPLQSINKRETLGPQLSSQARSLIQSSISSRNNNVI